MELWADPRMAPLILLSLENRISWQVAFSPMGRLFGISIFRRCSTSRPQPKSLRHYGEATAGPSTTLRAVLIRPLTAGAHPGRPFPWLRRRRRGLRRRLEQLLTACRNDREWDGKQYAPRRDKLLMRCPPARDRERRPLETEHRMTRKRGASEKHPLPWPTGERES